MILPPKILERILIIISLDCEYESLSGDFAEQFNSLVKEKSYSSAVLWYVFQILKLLIPNLIHNIHRGAAMLKNYFKIAFRNLYKHKNYSFINIFGLAVGIACFVLISFFVMDELSYDNYHENAERIYRMGIDEFTPNSREIYAHTPQIMAPTMIDEFPEVVNAARLTSRTSRTVKYLDKEFDEIRIVSSESNFINMFKIPFIDGDPNTALDNPNSVLITEAMAEKYFADIDPMGKVLLFDDIEFLVTGIIEDLPHNTHLSFDFIRSTKFERVNWGSFSVFTYIELIPDVDLEDFKAKLPDFYKRYVGPRYEDFEDFQARGNGMIFLAENVRDIHLKTTFKGGHKPGGNYNNVVLFGIISLFILLIACINFMNISTARSLGRAKEVGVRKVLGSFRKQLIYQFMVEALLSSYSAMILAVILLLTAEPYFNSLSGKEFSMMAVPIFYLVPAIVLFPLVIGIFAGSYPAFYLSAFRPISVLKDKISGSKSNAFLRNGLVIFQFCVSIALIIGTMAINAQKTYMLNKNLGFDKDQIMIMSGASDIEPQIDSFKEILKSYPEILNVSNSRFVPGGGFAELFFRIVNQTPAQQYNITVGLSDKDFVDTYGLEIIKGRDFSKDLLSDSSSAVINEAAYKLLGLDDLETKRITWGGNNIFKVIGVVKDFHYKSLHEEIKPFITVLNWGDSFSIKFRSDDVEGVLNTVREEWNKISGSKPFRYYFLNEGFEKLYYAEKQSSELLTLFSILAIFIGCLGLFGLVSFSAEKRTKEIGIRKVLGASIAELFLMLSKDFIKLALVAFTIVSPFAYYGITKWLETYAYRIDVPLDTFLYAGIIIVMITLVTISYQALKAANSNPTDVLRNE